MGQSEVRWCDRCGGTLTSSRETCIGPSSRGGSTTVIEFDLCAPCAEWLRNEITKRESFVAVAKERT